MSHIKNILAALLFGALVSVDVDAGMGSLISGDHSIMLVNRQIELKKHRMFRDVYVIDNWIAPDERIDLPRIARVTAVRKVNSVVYVNALTFEASAQDDKYLRGAPMPDEVAEITVEIVHPGCVVQVLDADDYHSSTPEGAQIFVRLLQVQKIK